MESQREYFNNLAHKWDEICYHDSKKIEMLLDYVGINKGDKILDVGCGTGVLTLFLRKLTGDGGSITSVDISENMIEAAKKKFSYDNVEFVAQDIMEFKPSEKYNAIILYSCFPHFQEKEQLIKRLYGYVDKGGSLSICHSQSRDDINRVHSKNKMVEEDVLPEAHYTAYMMKKTGLAIKVCLENDNMYIVSGTSV
ncbi:demethylmenaquinone methyltransferase [Oxobacter pfennigii]|uniref:Demethylmenaquinone methyltransferase n=1 Tax=Oxobacter pfennigii TaxID=36849 RepID=A0A0P8W6K4_9CLOT|nr:class I SAM-dependent methyltransferase [Oxobacter pfennigii]KPU43382.1 demethylmenaquinone methyltransferase [Oxobacter pfennigii]